MTRQLVHFLLRFGSSYSVDSESSHDDDVEIKTQIRVSKPSRVLKVRAISNLDGVLVEILGTMVVIGRVESLSVNSRTQRCSHQNVERKEYIPLLFKADQLGSLDILKRQRFR